MGQGSAASTRWQPLRRFTEADVAAMRRLKAFGCTYAGIAARYNTSGTHVRRLILQLRQERPTRPVRLTPAESEELQVFVDALREWLGLPPLFGRDVERTNAERFYTQPFEEPRERAPRTHG